MPTKKQITRYHELKRIIKDAERELSEIRTSMNITEPGIFTAGNVVLEVVETRRFDPVQAGMVLTKEELDGIMVLTPSSALARETLAPKRYAETQAVTGLQFNFKEVKPDEID